VGSGLSPGEPLSDLLVGNFGDGGIHAYNATTGTFADTLVDAQGNPLVTDGLWGLLPGSGGPGAKDGSGLKVHLHELQKHIPIARQSAVTAGMHVVADRVQNRLPGLGRLVRTESVLA